MRRIVVLSSVVAMMVVMMAVSVAPAFAARPVYRCTDGINYYFVYKKEVRQLESLGLTCVRTSSL